MKKEGLCPALALIVLGLLFGTLFASGQDTTHSSPGSKSAGLPNAPSTTQSTTCAENNGKLCPEWVHKIVGQYPTAPESGQFQPYRDASSVHFWTYRGWQDPPLRTDREVFRSKVFVAAHVGAIVMFAACRTKNSGEDWGSEVPAVAALFGMDYLQFRFVGGPNAVAPAVYEMIRYGIASTR